MFEMVEAAGIESARSQRKIFAIVRDESRMRYQC
jgi:hypothetical protein